MATVIVVVSVLALVKLLVVVLRSNNGSNSNGSRSGKCGNKMKSHGMYRYRDAFTNDSPG